MWILPLDGLALPLEVGTTRGSNHDCGSGRLASSTGSSGVLPVELMTTGLRFG
jgi:hypothetical protein